MGGRRLPPTQALALLVALLAFIAGCKSGGKDADPTTPTAASIPSASPTATPTSAPPTPTPTPNPLAKRPATANEAIDVLTRYFANPGVEPCSNVLVEQWKATCKHGDLDGDGKEDDVYLIPLETNAPRSPNPGTVVVRRAGSGRIERFPAYSDADVSILGLSVFTVADRTGDGRPEVSFLVNTCNATGCASHVEFQGWDGTAWRDFGPGEPGIDNITGVSMEGTGAATVVSMHGGRLTAPGAGPTREATFTFTFENGRYAPSSTVYDPPVYLYHAIVDADALFAAGRFAEAIDAYRGAIANTALKDWKEETGVVADGQPSGRDQLASYALFRIAVATAAMGQDPTSAFDDAIVQSKEPLFSNATEAFRRGYREVGGVHAGCLEVTRYLSDKAVADYVSSVFNYGYANQPRRYGDICNL
ncbi:MAG: hypothetical protein ACM3S1_11285 [Hyphomicrobiales bacterium]